MHLMNPHPPLGHAYPVPLTQLLNVTIHLNASYLSGFFLFHFTLRLILLRFFFAISFPHPYHTTVPILDTWHHF